MNETNLKVVSRQMMRLLPTQILLAAVGAIEAIVSSYFASNYIGIDAMSVVGVFAPVSLLIGAIGNLLTTGSAIVCGKYLGRNEQDKVQKVFSLDLLLTALIALLFSALFLIMGLFDLTGIFTRDPAVRPLFNRYLIGQVVGFLPIMLGAQLPAYLVMENRQALGTIASVVHIVVDVIMNILFVQMLHMGIFGLALASAISAWVFLAVQAVAFLSGKASLRLKFGNIAWKDTLSILRIGLPAAAGNAYQTLRGIIVNNLMAAFLGSVAISAFAAANNLLSFFWAIPAGMLAVSRLMISVSVGEEDRQTLTDIMRVMFKRYIPIMCVICAVIMLCAEPFTRLFYRDPSEPVYMMTVWGFRILPLCMPLSIIVMHFSCYGQASDKTVLVNVVSVLDGVVCVAGFTALLIRGMGIYSVYTANVLNGVVCALAFVVYSCLKRKRFPTNMEQLMVIPDDFGVSPDARIDISVQSMDEVLMVSRRVTEFCRKRGIDERRVYLASLCMEETAGNIVEHGFTKDNRRHSIDIRVVHKNDDVIMRVKDDCVPFDPETRRQLNDPGNRMKNIGIRIVYQSAQSVEYHNILGLNVLTIRI